MNFTITVDIDAPPDRVWAVMSDIERWPEWTPTVTSIARMGHRPADPTRRVSAVAGHRNLVTLRLSCDRNQRTRCGKLRPIVFTGAFLPV
jgi:uncharacterized protein YndB with AHSA1/START domain